MSKINASVVIPSHRSDASSVRRLISTIDLFLKQGFEVVLSDNSGCAIKAERLHSEFSDALVFAKTEVDCKAADNFFAGFSAATGQYVLFVSDDDIFLPHGVSALAQAIEAGGYHGFCAPVIRHTQDHVMIVNPPDLSSFDRTEHLLQWATCDASVSFYGCYSQIIWQRYFRLIRKHPVKFAHHDQLLRLVIADVGYIACLPTAWLVYDCSNWSDAQSVYNTLETFYLASGFDGRMYYAEPLWEGIEGILCQFTLDNLAGRNIQPSFVQTWWTNRWNVSKQFINSSRATMPTDILSLITPLEQYLNSSDSVDAYQILKLLSEFMIGIYGTDGGLQHFWLFDAQECLKP